jgi:hypothetical protein
VRLAAEKAISLKFNGPAVDEVLPFSRYCFSASSMFWSCMQATLRFRSSYRRHIRILSTVDFRARPNHLFIVAVSVASGLIPTLSPSLFQHLPAWISPITHTGVVLGSIVAFLLNLFFNGTTAQQIASTPTTFLSADEDQM